MHSIISRLYALLNVELFLYNEDVFVCCNFLDSLWMSIIRIKHLVSSTLQPTPSSDNNDVNVDGGVGEKMSEDGDFGSNVAAEMVSLLFGFVMFSFFYF